MIFLAVAHALATLIIWQHFFYVKYRVQEAKVPDGANLVLVEKIDAADCVWSDASDYVSDGVVTADNGATDGRRVIEYVYRTQVRAFA